jgi:hypothetical protein
LTVPNGIDYLIIGAAAPPAAAGARPRSAPAAPVTGDDRRGTTGPGPRAPSRVTSESFTVTEFGPGPVRHRGRGGLAAANAAAAALRVGPSRAAKRMFATPKWRP